MPLSEFILGHLEPLLDDWTTFARTIPAARDLDTDALRDHAAEMLRTIASDMRAEQTPLEQQRKSEGQGERASADDSPAEAHGSARRRSGFEMMEMVNEFRALRATVVRQWLAAENPSGTQAVQELVRFSEGLDQALAESLDRFSQEVDEARGLFMGVISHDMRNPIAASINAARYLQRRPGLDPRALNAVDIVLRNNERLSQLTSDLLEFVRLRFAHRPASTPTPVDLHALCGTVLATLRISHPGAALTLSSEGDVQGRWDASSLERLVSNLVENAIKHGTGGIAAVGLHGDADTVRLTVWNPGEPIAADRLALIFEPLTTWPPARDRATARDASYGLGLYIAREIVREHAGDIRAGSSAAGGCTFTVSLPRQPWAEPRAGAPAVDPGQDADPRKRPPQRVAFKA